MKKGITAAGNWVIDKVKIIDTLPERNMLANILEEARGNGGAPFNVLIDLARMNAEFPLHAAGVIGDDEDGEYILKTLAEYNIDFQHMHKSSEASTSYTDVMTEKGTGNRTFFHCRGANALLDEEVVEDIQQESKLFHLGYLLLLDKLDEADADYGVKAAKVLHMLQQKGFKTSVDVVSEASDRFRKVVTPSLKYINYLILNEMEAGSISGQHVRDKDEKINKEALQKAAEYMIDNGVNDMVVIHFPEGGYAMNSDKQVHFEPSYEVSNDEIKGTVGAGDAFCAGILYGIHEELPLPETLQIANANARFNLLNPTATDGAVSIDTVRNFISSAQQKKSVL